MLVTALGLTWLATWHRMTPSARAAEIFSGNGIRNRLSIVCESKQYINICVSYGKNELFTARSERPILIDEVF